MIPHDFFRDEVRCGFRIPAAIKQAWAAQMRVLAAIDAVCAKHGIEYFAEWGTLLGAVRHRGFIPWDDDLDIGMKREDYIRFRAVADSELPEGYVIHDYGRQKDHWLFLARVVNRDRFSFDPEELAKWDNYPWLAGIDIFILDYCYRDEKKEEERRKEILKLIALADGNVEGRFSKETIRAQLSEIRNIYGQDGDFPEILRQDGGEFLLPDREGSFSAQKGAGGRTTSERLGAALYRLAEQQMARVKASDADRLVQIFPWGLKGATGLPKEWYDNTVRLPFEFMDIPVPAAYVNILANRYGSSWMEIHKVWGGHGYPSFEGQRENLQKVADFELPCFKWDPGMIRTCDSEGKLPTRGLRVLLLPVGPAEWGSMKRIYEALKVPGGNELIVVPLPLLYKNALGEVISSDEEMFAADHFDEYPYGLPSAHWYDIDPSSGDWDIIVIQDPYDGENPCLTVPPVFYAENLQNCTRRLVYIPSYETCEFGENDRNDRYNMKHYVTAPGVIRADEVIVQSANIRKQYINALTAFAGEDTRDIWERKIHTFAKCGILVSND